LQALFKTAKTLPVPSNAIAVSTIRSGTFIADLAAAGPPNLSPSCASANEPTMNGCGHRGDSCRFRVGSGIPAGITVRPYRQPRDAMAAALCCRWHETKGAVQCGLRRRFGLPRRLRLTNSLPKPISGVLSSAHQGDQSVVHKTGKGTRKNQSDSQWQSLLERMNALSQHDAAPSYVF
jgi:hypothetical protein